MARIIAEALDGDLDVVLVRKLRAPGQPGFAIGAVDEQGQVLKGAHFDSCPSRMFVKKLAPNGKSFASGAALYRGAARLDPVGRVVIIVDDGIATGSSMLSAIRSPKARGAKRIVVATAVAPARSVDRIAAEADEVVVCTRQTTSTRSGSSSTTFPR